MVVITDTGWKNVTCEKVFIFRFFQIMFRFTRYSITNHVHHVGCSQNCETVQFGKWKKIITWEEQNKFKTCFKIFSGSFFLNKNVTKVNVWQLLVEYWPFFAFHEIFGLHPIHIAVQIVNPTAIWLPRNIHQFPSANLTNMVAKHQWQPRCRQLHTYSVSCSATSVL